MNASNWLVASIVLTVVFCPMQSAYAAPYAIVNLGDLAPGFGESHPSDINDHGQVVGTAYIGSNFRAFMWDGRGVVDLGDLPGGLKASGAARINNRGQVVGSAHADSGERAVLWHQGRTVDLGRLDHDGSTSARGINDHGKVIGRSGLTQFIWQHGVMTDFQMLPGAGNIHQLFAINNHGEVVGSYGNPLFEHAVLWSNGVTTDLGDLPGGTGFMLSTGDWSVPSALNDFGQVVGMSDSAAGMHPFLWENGRMIDLGTLPGEFRVGSANDINNFGVVVGSFNGANGEKPFVWDKINGMRDLNSLLYESSPRWTLRRATSINNLGQIVGQGYYDGRSRGFLLTPIPEPSTLWITAVAVTGVMIIALANRRPRAPLLDQGEQR
jgi:probable HAF family extracellular repeat protein